MIGSFWNLCRACPSMPIDKLHSEYRSTYRWHEYTGGPEVVRRPPVPNQLGAANEPPLPRRKKCPELAYRTTHDFVPCDESQNVTDKNIGNNVNRARSEERGTPSRRSKSAGPPGSGRSTIAMTNGIGGGTHLEEQVKTSGQPGESSGLFKKTISKLSTEYRIQFVWPHVRRAIKGVQADDVIDPPRKSVSMSAIKPTQSNKIPMIHKKRTTNQNEAAIHELEPLVRETEEKIHNESRKEPPRVDFRKGNRPHSHYDKNASDREKYGFSGENKQEQRIDNKIIPNGYGGSNEPWYKEVIELRKKAGEYKCRGWGMEIDPDLHKKQRDLWDQVSRRTSLSALSLASTVRPITKEEKEKENNKKSSPTKAVGRFPGHALPLDNKSAVDGPLFNGRMRRHTVRHHLERTTGPDVEEGALLPSPTREKLMPTIPKSKDDESISSQRGSPKKSANSRHGSPQKGSPQKGSPKKMTKVGRSQSVGPGVIQNESSPKRQIRSGNTVGNTTAPTISAVTPTVKAHKKTPIPTTTVGGERRPRPTTLSTTVRNRSKSSSLPPNVRAQSAPNNNIINNSNQNNSQINNSKASPSNLNVPHLRKTNKSLKQQQRPKSSVIYDTTIKTDDQLCNKGRDKTTAETDDESADNIGTSISSASPLPPPEFTEHIVKSPPEPTRVKSPEQILMRSPDPVNWTVPLDTGKTFTVTQNVRDDPMNRPQSEFKASTPIDKPLAPQSAPPELAEQAKMEAWKSERDNEPNTTASTTTTSSSVTPNIPEPRYDKAVPGSTLRCLEDPIFDPEINSPSMNRNPAVDVLEKARNRFDRFWGGNNPENKDTEENV